MIPSSLISFSLIALVLIFHSIAANNNNSHLIQQTCKNSSKTDPNISYKFCVSSLQAFPHSSCVKSLRQLGLISINLTRHNITDTKAYIEKLLKKKNIEPFVKDCLDDCLELYSDAIETVGDAIKDYKAKRYADANIDMSSVLDAPTTCEDGFKERNDDVSPLKKRNKDAFQLSAIALSIINMLSE
ncbi:hypothetical protein L6164_002030 [Bauhinia variegata]|uniref:Uncharacterized protein n=1 Tax=Bauhinia variegata TaxID=167791 RepID=A0ACB9PWF4_BAUVA|nr:hypothetical protein L6164_002030 [Bauhinia variegata]